MKATLLVDNDIFNHAYDTAEKQRVEAEGGTYTIKPYVTLKAGSTIEGNGVFELCTCPTPKAVPRDDEATAKVLAYFNSPARRARKAEILSMARPEVFKDLPPAKQAYVEHFAKKWKGTEVDKIDNGETSPPKKSTK